MPRKKMPARPKKKAPVKPRKSTAIKTPAKTAKEKKRLMSAKKLKEDKKFLAAKAHLALEDIGAAKRKKIRAATKPTKGPIKSMKGRRAREKDLLEDL